MYTRGRKSRMGYGIMIKSETEHSYCRYNAEQEKVIMAEDGCHLVLAGAGTGKTFTIVERVTYLLKTGRFMPSQVLLLTFSKKAADELRLRIERRCGCDSGSVMATTFHSFALYLLRRFGETAHSRPRVIDRDESIDILAGIASTMRDSFMGIPVPVILGMHSRFRLGKRISLPGELQYILEYLEKLDREYDQYKEEHGVLDFNDMIHDAIELLSTAPSVRDHVREQFKYVMVDEFQDTSKVNFELLSLLVHEDDPALTVVGDDWQSIYGFRNARVEYIVNMRRYFPAVTIYKLTQNYRSKSEILTLGEKIIKRNRFRTRKKVFSTMGKGGIVRGYGVSSIEEECAKVVSILKEYYHDDHDIAVLYRNNWQGERIKKEIARCGDEQYGSLQFMTIHASKGLEFHTVILIGVCDGVFPDPSTDIEEERRLLYVACTRARERLMIVFHLTGDDQPSSFAREAGF